MTRAVDGGDLIIVRGVRTEPPSAKLAPVTGALFIFVYGPALTAAR
jgi:hypothetical protein